MALLYMPVNNNTNNNFSNHNPQSGFSFGHQNSRIRVVQEQINAPADNNQQDQPLPLNLDLDDAAETLEHYYSQQQQQQQQVSQEYQGMQFGNMDNQQMGPSQFPQEGSLSSFSSEGISNVPTKTIPMEQTQFISSEEPQPYSSSASSSPSSSISQTEERQSDSQGQEFLENFSRFIQRDRKARERKPTSRGNSPETQNQVGESSHSIRMEGRINRKSNQPKDYDGMVLKFKKKRKFL